MWIHTSAVTQCWLNSNPIYTCEENPHPPLLVWILWLWVNSATPITWPKNDTVMRANWMLLQPRRLLREDYPRPHLWKKTKKISFSAITTPDLKGKTVTLVPMGRVRPWISWVFRVSIHPVVTWGRILSSPATRYVFLTYAVLQKRMNVSDTDQGFSRKSVLLPPVSFSSYLFLKRKVFSGPLVVMITSNQHR